jgi:hypothetical protein
MDTKSVLDLKPFLPAEDYALAKQFLQDKKIAEKYPDITTKPPTLQPWGLRVLYLSDPSGVLWHIADDRKS